jgi:hypothetical protein
MPPLTPVFVFHGDVVAFGTRLDRPRRREARGAVALARVGGRSSTQDEALNLDDRLRFRYASSAASGESYQTGDGETHETRATCTLEGLEFDGVVRADFVSATLVSAYTDHHRFIEETVALRGLWVNGTDRSIEKRVPRILTHPCRGLSELKQMADKSGALAADLAQLHTTPDGSPSGHAGKLAQSSSGHLVCYLLEPNYITFDRNGIRYELFLGEYLIDDQQRRLTMLRIEAHPLPETRAMRAAAASGEDTPPDDSGGSDDSGGLEGSTTVAQLAINGHRFP